MQDCHEESLSAVTQSVAIIPSTSSLNWAKLVTGILGKQEPLSNNSSPVESTYLYCHPWLIDNKYYEATVQLSVLNEDWPMQLSSIQEHAQAIIIYWDNTHVEPLKLLDGILDKLQDFQPEVCLLVCDEFSKDAKVSRYDSQKWCIDNGWELVELEQTLPEFCDDEDCLDDDFMESRSYERICGALQAIMWPVLHTKMQATPLVNSLLSESSDPFAGSLYCPGESVGDKEVLREPEDDDFETLFAQFEHLRITAQTLPRKDRLDYAEKVAMAFLRSMGGDEEGREVEDALDEGASNDSIALEEIPEGYAFKKLIEEEDSTDSSYATGVCLVEELGFPLLEKSSSSANSDTETSNNELHGTIENIDLSEELPFTSLELSAQVRSYEDIENELHQEDLKQMVLRMKEKELIQQDMPTCDEPSKRVKT